MDNSIESIKNRIKSKRNYNVIKPLKKENKDNNKKINYLRNLFSRTMIAIILILISIIYINYSTTNLLMYKRYVFNDVWSFNKINEFYNNYLGGVLPFENILRDTTTPVFNEQLIFRNSTPFKDGVALEVGTKYLVPALNSGIVVFIGDREDYGRTVIIQGIDGVDIWYGNINHNNLKLYDYIEKGSLLGETITDKLHLVLMKDGKHLSFEEYTQ